MYQFSWGGMKPKRSVDRTALVPCFPVTYDTQGTKKKPSLSFIVTLSDCLKKLQGFEAGD
jgi:hypothetical protein